VCGNVENLNFLLDLFISRPIDLVIHLAANSDIRSGTLSAERDFRDTLQTTLALAELSKVHQIKKLIFASSSAIFGIQDSAISGSESEPKMPASTYGWAKLASEHALEIVSAVTGFELEILRFPNVVGPKMTHGALFDFRQKLNVEPEKLNVLGNGYQSKPYIHVSDLCEIIFQSLLLTNNQISKKLVGPFDTITIREMVDLIKIRTNTEFEVFYQDSAVGWEGDVPRYSYSRDNLISGQKFSSSIKAVEQAISELWTENE